jgi:hypothetical protein
MARGSVGAEVSLARLKPLSLLCLGEEIDLNSAHALDAFVDGCVYYRIAGLGKTTAYASRLTACLLGESVNFHQPSKV